MKKEKDLRYREIEAAVTTAVREGGERGGNDQVGQSSQNSRDSGRARLERVHRCAGRAVDALVSGEYVLTQGSILGGGK